MLVLSQKSIVAVTATRVVKVCFTKPGNALLLRCILIDCHVSCQKYRFIISGFWAHPKSTYLKAFEVVGFEFGWFRQISRWKLVEPKSLKSCINCLWENKACQNLVQTVQVVTCQSYLFAWLLFDHSFSSCHFKTFF